MEALIPFFTQDAQREVCFTLYEQRSQITKRKEAPVQFLVQKGRAVFATTTTLLSQLKKSCVHYFHSCYGSKE